MKKIPLTQGKFATVDDDVYERLTQWKWFAWLGGRTWYARRSEGKAPTQKCIYMHREIVNASNAQVDHRDGNGLNNQRFNLRLCTHRENMRNRSVNKNNRNGFKGVTRVGKKFRARIEVHKENIHLGYFPTLEEAARVYDDAAKKYFGEFARTNF